MCDCKYEVCACIVWKSKQETDNLKKKLFIYNYNTTKKNYRKQIICVYSTQFHKPCTFDFKILKYTTTYMFCLSLHSLRMFQSPSLCKLCTLKFKNKLMSKTNNKQKHCVGQWAVNV